MTMGLTDRPADQDHLDIEAYYVGLADFIAECPTPMTVALQGDWGTGKTSAMKMVQQLLEERSAGAKVAGDVKVVDFNTWQYSQFDLGDQLVFTLLQAILDKIAPPEQVTASGELLRKVARISRYIGAAAGAFTRTMVSASGGAVGQATVASLDGVLGAVKDDVPEVDRATQLVDVRADFAKIVRDRVGLDAQVASRVVVFIDDLDRLPPVRAIEVMEALKTLFDCPGCVFVMAIDFDVVKRGVRLKYGNEMSDAKARAYFDKFIQVPFQMPVSEYDIGTLLRSSLLELGLTLNDTRTFEELTRLSVGANPRALKRLLNMLVLLTRVADARSDGEEVGKHERAFALLALEAAYPRFNAEVRAADTADLRDLLSSVTGTPDTHAETRDPADWGIAPERVKSFREFVSLLNDLLGTEKEMDRALRETALTTVGGQKDVSAVTDPVQKAAMASEEGVNPDLIKQAEVLEELLREELSRRGGRFESALRSKATWWHWYVSSGDRSKSWGQLTFPAGGSIRLYFGPPRQLEKLRLLEEGIRTLAARHGWRLQTSDKGTYFRLYEIGAHDDISELVPILAECALISLKGGLPAGSPGCEQASEATFCP